MIDNKEQYEFKFYEWEKKNKDKPLLRQPFGDKWEEYTWGEVGVMARKLATGLKSLQLRENAHIGIYSKNCREWVENNASTDIFANKVVKWLNKVISEYK